MYLRIVALTGMMLAGIFLSSTFARPLAAPPADNSPAGQKTRIGVYDARAVAIAYIRGHRDDDRVKQLYAELKEAEDTGNKARAAEIRAEGERLQTLRHLQGFAGVAVDDIMLKLADRLPQLARDAGVVAIVHRADYASGDVEVVDVTDRIVADLDPDAQTQKILQDMRGKKPVSVLDVLAMKPTD